MADTIIAFPLYGSGKGTAVPVRAVDNGDSTYSIAVSKDVVFGTGHIAMPGINNSGTPVEIATVYNGDNTFSIKVDF